jgi:recombination protein RecA
MTSDKKRKLEMTIAAMHKRWQVQPRARPPVRPSSPATAAIPTGFPILDEALAIGGIPRGRITEIIGIPTSGMATLALKIMAQAQTEAGTAVYMDLDRTFDPDYAAHCGVALRRLLLVHPRHERQALVVLRDFLQSGDASVLVFDAPFRLLATPALAQAFSSALGRSINALGQGGCALLCLTPLPPQSSPSLASYPRHVTLPHYATVRLLIQKERWLYRQRDIRGYQAQVLVVKNQLATAGQQVSLTITFNGVIPAGKE